jgi:hypothetical protein
VCWYVLVGGMRVEGLVLGGGSYGSSVGWMWVFGAREWFFVRGWDCVGVRCVVREGSEVWGAVWLCPIAFCVLLMWMVGSELEWGMCGG